MMPYTVYKNDQLTSFPICVFLYVEFQRLYDEMKKLRTFS